MEDCHMKKRTLSERDLPAFAHCLYQEERAPSTVEKYLRDIREFLAWRGEGKAPEKMAVLAYRDHLLAEGLSPVTVNAKLSALNRFFRFLGREDCRVHFLNIQRQVFRDRSRELTKAEYSRLLETARTKGRDRLELLMEAICSTGIRVSEVRYLTVAAARIGRAVIRLKGKIRTVLLPGKLCRKLLKYAEKQKIASGEIFLTRNGAGLSRKQIWREMKGLCKEARVEPSKVFPHNLRHLFATAFYRACKDIVKLADVLGHSNIETTRVYLITTGMEHARCLERLGFIT